MCTIDAIVNNTCIHFSKMIKTSKTLFFCSGCTINDPNIAQWMITSTKFHLLRCYFSHLRSTSDRCSWKWNRNIDCHSHIYLYWKCWMLDFLFSISIMDSMFLLVTLSSGTHFENTINFTYTKRRLEDETSTENQFPHCAIQCSNFTSNDIYNRIMKYGWVMKDCAILTQFLFDFLNNFLVYFMNYAS